MSGILALYSEVVVVLTILSAAFAIFSLGGLVLAQSEIEARDPRRWALLATVGWCVFGICFCAFTVATSTPRP